MPLYLLFSPSATAVSLSLLLLYFQRKADPQPHALVYAVDAGGDTASRRSKHHRFPAVTTSATQVDDGSALQRRDRFRNPLTATVSAAYGAAGAAVGSALRRLRPKRRRETESGCLHEVQRQEVGVEEEITHKKGGCVTGGRGSRRNKVQQGEEGGGGAEIG